jgi:hypothetical protein
MAIPIETTSSATGLEIVRRQAQRQLRARLGIEMAAQEEAWAPLDKQDAAESDIVYRAEDHQLERVRPEHIFRGDRPSILRLPPTFYPAVTVMSDAARPDPESEMRSDVFVYRDMLWIEIVCKSQKVDPANIEEAFKVEGLLSEGTTRAAEAIIQALYREPTLGGVCDLSGSTPSTTIAEPFQIKSLAPDKRGQTWLFQMARIDVTLRKYAIKPQAEEPDPEDRLVGFGS